MFRIIKVEGDSMSPDYNSGDYLLVSRFPLLFNFIRINTAAVFNSSKYGVMIKKVSEIDSAKKQFFFKGANQMSVTTEMIGAIDKKNIIGVVLLHFKK